MLQKSAGIIPFRNKVSSDGQETDELEFFVGRPWENSDYAAFLKGGIEDGENIEDTAIREFKEESGLPMNDCNMQMLIPLGWVRQNSQKKVFAFGLHYPNINPDVCFSNLCPNGKPEIVKYEWVTYDEIKNRTSKPHLLYYEKLIELAKSNTI